MEVRRASDSTAVLERTVRRASTCGSGTRKRFRAAWPSMLSSGYLTVGVVVLFIAVQFSSPIWAASLTKRSADGSEETCRTRAICGWEVYHPSTRNLQYYVASSCKCSTKETCLRAEDDISISAYVFRCSIGRRKKTSGRPTTELNETDS